MLLPYLSLPLAGVQITVVCHYVWVDVYLGVI